MTDPYDLDRFVTAQDSGGVHAHAATEMRAGRKTGHWMWFVFPQIAGLGMSAMSQRYAISSLDEATAYLAHPVLGPRLRQDAQIVADSTAGSAVQIFGGIDAQKLQSSMTLFEKAAPDEPVFGAVLDRFFQGHRDAATQAQL